MVQCIYSFLRCAIPSEEFSNTIRVIRATFFILKIQIEVRKTTTVDYIVVILQLHEYGWQKYNFFYFHLSFSCCRVLSLAFEAIGILLL